MTSARRCRAGPRPATPERIRKPFISGSVAKTVNLPARTPATEVGELFVRSWKLGLKSITGSRDGSKRLPPVEETFGPLARRRPAGRGRRASRGRAARTAAAR